MIKFTIITLFREAIEPYLKASMMWKASEKGLAEFDFVNLRDFGLGPHKSVDDTPYGGGDGMLLRCEPVFEAIESVKASDPDAKVILPTPVGETWTQEMARFFAGAPSVSRSGARPAGPSPRAAGANTRAAALRTPLRQDINIFFPTPSLSGDNGAMVAAAAYYEVLSGVEPTDPYKLNIYPRIEINKVREGA